MPTQNNQRQQIRDKRNALDHATRLQAASDVYEQISQSRVFKCSQHIGLYYAKGAELNIDALIHLAWLQGKSAYLPVVTPRYMNRLWFAAYEPGADLVPNRYNIPEPVLQKQQRAFKVIRLDLILVPLVGFDRRGNRIGMGAGYYDRTLATLKGRTSWQRPYLMGVAYDFQEIDQIRQNSWDIPLHAVATNREIIECTPR